MKLSAFVPISDSGMADKDIEALERATLAAVSPEAVEALPGWLLPFDSGTVGRAHSAVPLTHAVQDAAVVALIEARYAAQGMKAVFRIPCMANFDSVRRELLRRGYAAGKPTQVQTGSARRVLHSIDATLPMASVETVPDAAWAALFLGEGFDPVDGASRVRSLSRGQHTVFASWREAGQTVAAGAGSYSFGWASVHGIRTQAACRGRGLANRVMAALATEAVARGLDRIFLQVEAGNAPAQALYQRLGFTPAWQYEYWNL